MTIFPSDDCVYMVMWLFVHSFEGIAFASA